MNGRNIKSVIAGIRYEGLKPKVYLRMLDPSEWTGTRPNKKKVESLLKRKISELPPVVVVKKRMRYEIIDGLHRVSAAKKKKEKIPAYIIPGEIYKVIRGYGDTLVSEWASFQFKKQY